MLLKADLKSDTISVTINRKILMSNVLFLASCAIAIDGKNCKYQFTSKWHHGFQYTFMVIKTKLLNCVFN